MGTASSVRAHAAVPPDEAQRQPMPSRGASAPPHSAKAPAAVPRSRRTRSGSTGSTGMGEEAGAWEFDERMVRRALAKLQLPPEKIDELVPAVKRHVENPESHSLDALLPESDYVRGALYGLLTYLAAARELMPPANPAEMEAAAGKALADGVAAAALRDQRRENGSSGGVMKRLWRRRSSRESKYKAAESPTVSPTTSNSTARSIYGGDVHVHTPEASLSLRGREGMPLPQRLPPMPQGGTSALLSGGSAATPESVVSLAPGSRHTGSSEATGAAVAGSGSGVTAALGTGTGRAELPALQSALSRRRSSGNLAGVAAAAEGDIVPRGAAVSSVSGVSGSSAAAVAAAAAARGGVVTITPLATDDGSSGGGGGGLLRRGSRSMRRRSSDSSQSQSRGRGTTSRRASEQSGQSGARGSIGGGEPPLELHVKAAAAAGADVARGGRTGGEGGASSVGGSSNGHTDALSSSIVLFPEPVLRHTYVRTGDAAPGAGFGASSEAGGGAGFQQRAGTGAAVGAGAGTPPGRQAQQPHYRMASERSFMCERAMVTKGMWKLGHQIGKGSFGNVHIGLNEASGDLIAVKILPLWKEELRDRVDALAREFELMRTLKHENIVRYLGAEVNDDEGTMCIFQEWVPGSVTSLLDNFGPFSEVRISDYTRQILEGLCYLHRQRVLHRDIKGSNILIDDRGVVKLCDFGASKNLNEIVGIGSHTRVGSPLFMAPEILLKEEYGPKVDIWSLGGAVLEMATGHPPWHALNFRTPVALINWVRKDQGPPPIPPTLSPLLTGFLLRCFQRDPANRPSADELIRDEFLARPMLPAATAGGAARPAMVLTESVSDLEGMPIREAKERIRRASITYNKSESSLLRRGSTDHMGLDPGNGSGHPSNASNGGGSGAGNGGNNHNGGNSSLSSTPPRSPSSASHRERRSAGEGRGELSRSASSAASTPATSPERVHARTNGGSGNGSGSGAGNIAVHESSSMPELLEGGAAAGQARGSHNGYSVNGGDRSRESSNGGDRSRESSNGGDGSRSPSRRMQLNQQLSVDTRNVLRRNSASTPCMLHAETPLSGSKHGATRGSGGGGASSGCGAGSGPITCTCGVSTPATPASPSNPWSGRRRRSAAGSVTPGSNSGANGSTVPSGASTPVPSSPHHPARTAVTGSVPATPSSTSSNPYSGRVRSPRRQSRSAGTSPVGSRDGTPINGGNGSVTGSSGSNPYGGRRRRNSQPEAADAAAGGSVLGATGGSAGSAASSVHVSSSGSGVTNAGGGGYAGYSAITGERLGHIRELSGVELSERLEDVLRQSNAALEDLALTQAVPEISRGESDALAVAAVATAPAVPTPIIAVTVAAAASSGGSGGGGHNGGGSWAAVALPPIATAPMRPAAATHQPAARYPANAGFPVEERIRTVADARGSATGNASPAAASGERWATSESTSLSSPSSRAAQMAQGRRVSMSSTQPLDHS